MMGTGLVPAERLEALQPALPDANDSDSPFDFSDLRIFTSIPPHHYDVVVMRGLVVVYDTECLGREGVQIGKLYVRESQRPPSCMPWEAWLDQEWKDRDRRGGPVSRLHTHREVVQAVNWPHEDDLALRLASGWTDGPYREWAFGMDLIGKVVGIYAPGRSGEAFNEG